MIFIRIFVKVKAISKRKPIINLLPYEIQEDITDINDLIAYIVKTNVKSYNEKKVDEPVFRYLTNEEIENSEVVGKIGFSDKKNDMLQDEDKAIENALQCFEDGIFRVLLNEKEIEFNNSINIKENDTFTFIHLTMLAGRLW